jgi:hypothetical protein
MIDVPQFDFTNLDFIVPPTSAASGSMDGPVYYTNGTDHERYDRYCYRGPSPAVQRVASAVGTLGSILQIQPPSLNSTWSIDFWGPNLRCRNATEQQRYEIWENLYYYLMDGDTCRDSYSYISWTPSDAQTFLPFPNVTRPGYHANTSSTLGRPHNSTLSVDMDGVFNKAATLMVAVIPQMFLSSVALPSHIIPGGCVMTSTAEMDYSSYDSALANGFAQTYFGDATLLECKAFNSSFSATFTYRNGVQDIDVTRHKDVVDQPLVRQKCFYGPLGPTNGGNFQNAAYAEEGNSSCSTLNLIGKQCKFDAELLRTLAYQAVIDSFNKLVIGTVGLAQEGAAPSVVQKTNLFESLLLNTKELAFLKAPHANYGFPSLSVLYASSLGKEYSGLYRTPELSYSNPLADALEELFQNITISLLSESLLL